MLKATIVIPEADYDSVWKEAIEAYFQAFVRIYFPTLYRKIDWKAGFKFMDKELRKIIAETGTRPNQVDKLVEVKFKNGGSRLIWLHIEVQSAKDPKFEERMFRYNSLARDRHGPDVISVAVLADLNKNWRPDTYHYKEGGFELKMKFPICKLLDREKKLERDFSVPAILLRAQLAALRQRKNLNQRLATKWTLVRSLYEHGYAKTDIQRLFVFIDRMITLPKDLELELENQLVEYEKKHEMPVLSPFEKRAIDKGVKQGVKQGTIDLVIGQCEKRFGDVPKPLLGRIEELDQPSAKELGIALFDLTSPKALEAWLDARK